jgi:short-subunit dehydrogenase
MRTPTLITGASSGLGEEMARQLAASGHDLALCARRTERLESLRDEITARHPGVRVEVRTLDVDDSDQVFEVFRGFAQDFGSLGRVVVNAGIGKGAPLGTGRFDANKATATTNFVSALAQVEAALEVFRAQDAGHLVVVSSVAALRPMPRAVTTYAATKAGLAYLAEGARADLRGTPIAVTVLYPGYIRSEMNERAGRMPPFVVSTRAGVAAMVAAIEKERPSARVPTWPWAPLGFALKHLPDAVVRRFAG